MFGKFWVSIGLLLTAMMISPANAQLPPTGYVTAYQGVELKGQCVPIARKLGEAILGRSLPTVGANGGAADLWTANTTSFRKIDRVSSNGTVKMPPIYSFIIWSKSVGGGYGHVAMAIGSVDGTRKIVRVVDTNWGRDELGQIHDVNLNDSRILGYLVWQ